MKIEILKYDRNWNRAKRSQSLLEETELQQKETEVSRLSLQLEEKCEQLRRSTLALETSNQAVDVFSVLIQHMTQSVSGSQMISVGIQVAVR